MNAKKTGICSLLPLLMLLLSMPAFSQPGRMLRVEIETRQGSRDIEVLPMGEEGVLVFYKTFSQAQDGMVQWHFKAYDSDLKEKWHLEYPLSQRMDILSQVYADGKARMLFAGRTGGQVKEAAIIAEIDHLGTSFNTSEVSIPERQEIHYFSYVSPGYVLGAHDRRFATSVWWIAEGGTSMPVLHGLKGETWLDDASWSVQEQELLLLFKHRESRKKFGLTLTAHGPDGKRRWEQSLPDDKDRTPVTGRFLSHDALTLVAGAYTTEDKLSSFSSASPETDFVSGFFSCMINKDKPQQLRIFPFSEITNYFSHLTYNEVSRMKQGRKGENVPLEFNVLFRQMAAQDASHVIMAEAYFPKYHYVTRMAYDYYGRPVPTNYTVFDGYQYTNAFVMALDTVGLKQWDQNFPIRNILTMELRNYVALLYDGEETLLAYLDQGRIAAQINRGNTVTGPFDYTEVEGADPGKKAQEHQDEQIRYWYDRYVLCSGFQKIRSQDAALGERRHVFYLTKVAYR